MNWLVRRPKRKKQLEGNPSWVATALEQSRIESSAADEDLKPLKSQFEADKIQLAQTINESVVGKRTYPTRGCGVSRFGPISKFYQFMI